jgi:antitoxin component YwqK of YwqJK toxin-antitoxin module
MHGIWAWYRKDGTKMRTGSFINDKQTGKWTTFDKTGKVVKMTNFN